MPVACIATAANVNDTLFFERWFLAVFAVMARIRAVFADSDQHRRKPVRDGSQFLALAIDLPGADIGAAGHLANPPGARLAATIARFCRSEQRRRRAGDYSLVDG